MHSSIILRNLRNTTALKRQMSSFLKTELPYEIAHDEALKRGELRYIDPETGYQVFTELAHEKRGKCCGNGCRHCPFEFENVKDTHFIMNPTILHRRPCVASSMRDKEVKVLFWSGGKDSFLALRSLIKQLQNHTTTSNINSDSDPRDRICLLTTFDARSKMVAHQELPIEIISRQAIHLNIDCIGIPLIRSSNEAYVSRIQRGLLSIQKDLGKSVSSLVFGDLHLTHIREWREDMLGNMTIDGESKIKKRIDSSSSSSSGTNDSSKYTDYEIGYKMEFPLWQADQRELMNDLEQSGIKVIVSAVPGTNLGISNDSDTNVDSGVIDPSSSSTTPSPVATGDEYTSQVFEACEAVGWDAFGENGEFHSCAQVWSVPCEQALGLK